MADQISTNKERSSPSQTQLDGLVVNIELTLISIIQGVAFSFLADNSSRVLVNSQFIFWPYAITGLLIILLFWSRSLIHALTVIRWPLKFGHNFMYVACTLVETIAFTQLTNPLYWYALNSVFALLAGILFALDLRLIRDRIADSAGQIGCRLYAIVEREQLLNMVGHPDNLDFQSSGNDGGVLLGVTLCRKRRSCHCRHGAARGNHRLSGLRHPLFYPDHSADRTNPPRVAR